jgi:hypothetical protein
MNNIDKIFIVMKLRKIISNIIRENLNEQEIFENSKLNKLLDFELDEVKIDDKYAHAELGVEQLSDGEVSIYISRIWSDIKGKGYATKLLNKIKKYSDKTDVPLSLMASAVNNIKTSGGLNQQELVDWYIKNGFRVSEEDNNFQTDSNAPFMVYNR